MRPYLFGLLRGRGPEFDKTCLHNTCTLPYIYAKPYSRKMRLSLGCVDAGKGFNDVKPIKDYYYTCNARSLLLDNTHEVSKHNTYILKSFEVIKRIQEERLC